MNRVIFAAMLMVSCTTKNELAEICGRPLPPAPEGVKGLDDRYLVYFSQLGKEVHSAELKLTFESLSHVRPSDQPTLLANAMREAGVTQCALLDALKQRYDHDPATGCDHREVPNCELRHVPAQFAKSWAAMPKEHQKYLSLESPSAADLAIVATASVSELYVHFATEFTSLAQLPDMKALRNLHIESAAMKNLSGSKGLENLQELAVGRALTSLDGVESLTGLQRLDISQSAVTDLRPIASLKSLEHLSASKSVPAAQIEMLKNANTKLRVSQY